MFSQARHSPDTAAAHLAGSMSFPHHGQRQGLMVQRRRFCDIDGIQQPSRNRPPRFVSETSCGDLTDARAPDQTGVCASGENVWNFSTPKKGQTR